MAEQNNQDINQLLKVRREKLQNLQEAGNDPFVITKYDQTHHSDEVKELYNAHEQKLLAGRVAPNTDGLDEAEARQVINDDYNERRAIMDADPINVSIAGRMMFKRVMEKLHSVIFRISKDVFRYTWQEIQSERMHTQHSRNQISEIFTE